MANGEIVGILSGAADVLRLLLDCARKAAEAPMTEACLSKSVRM